LPASVISIIDDDESMRFALAGLVRLLGFEAKTYSSAEEFLACDASEPPCCVITDIHMSGMSGIELKHRLDGRASAIPVILITGRSEPHLHVAASQSGAVCLLKKPFNADALLEGLRKAAVA
jgi:FixJ family two-component response regulator